MILVTNAMGRVSSELAMTLARLDVPFIAASQNADRTRDILGDGLETREFKWSMSEAYAAVLDGVKKVFMLHPLVTANNDQLKAFVDAAKAADVEHIVFMSGLGVGQRPDDIMCQIEDYIKASGMAYTLLRPNWFMQNFNTADLQSINEQGEIRMPSADHRLSLIDTRDIAAVAARILVDGGHEGAEYTLTGSEAVTYAEAAALISEASGRTVKHVSPTPDEILNKMRERGVPQEFVYMYEWLYEDMHSGLTAEISDAVKAITGREPITLKQYVADYAEAWLVEDDRHH